MAVFEYTHNGQRIQVRCAACGNTNMFQHQPTLLTCNRCGHTFNTPTPATTIVEQVIKVSMD